jgi:TPR repeat protein
MTRLLLVLGLAGLACSDSKTKPEAKPEAKTEAQPETKPETKAEAKTEAKKGEPAAESAAKAGPKLCADFAACRDGCGERKRGACVRMQRRAGEADKTEAQTVAARLCDAGHPEACHVQSIQLKANRARSGKALTRACELGYGPSCAELAAATRKADRAEELLGRAKILLERHCQQDEDPYSCAAIASAARFPPQGEKPELDRARWYYDRACDLGDEVSCAKLADQLDKKYPELELALRNRACELGEPTACARVGDHYAGAPPDTRDMARAEAAWQRACDSGADGVHDACNRLAEALLDGRLPRDQDRAAKLKKRGEELAGGKR